MNSEIRNALKDFSSAENKLELAYKNRAEMMFNVKVQFKTAC